MFECTRPNRDLTNIARSEFGSQQTYHATYLTEHRATEKESSTKKPLKAGRNHALSNPDEMILA